MFIFDRIILLQTNTTTFENLEKKNQISQNLAKVLTENFFSMFYSWFFLNTLEEILLKILRKIQVNSIAKLSLN